MGYIRSERNAAILLVLAAVVGLVLANSPAGPAALGLLDMHLAIPGIADLSVGHWISDGLLAIFFFVIAVELKHELTVGSLSDRRRAAVPAIAALGGVIVPALVFAAIAASAGLGQGWPIPTATDIAFALGLLALVGRSLPPRIRVFLLALAVLDDLVAILIIAVFFTERIEVLPLILAIVCAAVAGLVSRIRVRHGWVIVVALVILAGATWVFTLWSGVHATLAGVAIGLAIVGRAGSRAAHVLEPVSNGIVLPLFALSAAMVLLPSVSVFELSPAFWGIIAGLVVGKLVGITTAGFFAARLLHRGGEDALPLGDLVAVAALGSIGFTVSLLMNELAFLELPNIADEGTLAVLVGSLIGIIVSTVLVRTRVRHHARAAKIAAD